MLRLFQCRATGSVFLQIAKKVIGCEKVIGIAGGKEKCDWYVRFLSFLQSIQLSYLKGQIARCRCMH